MGKGGRRWREKERVRERKGGNRVFYFRRALFYDSPLLAQKENDVKKETKLWKREGDRDM